MTTKIKIKGVIIPKDVQWIYELFGFDATSPEDVVRKIEEANGDDLEVEINSPGGEVYSGSEIYTALADYKGKVEVKIVGVAASAASVVAMAGNPVKISPTAQMMIHNVWEIARGNHKTFEHEAEVLKGHDKSIANAYILKTGMTQKDLLKMMDKETWLDAQKAKQYSFVDEIMFDTGKKIAASAGNMLLPQSVIDKVRESFAEGKLQVDVNVGETGEQGAESESLRLYKAKLNLLKLRRVN